MMEPSETYFSVVPEDQAAAVAHVTERGFPPSRIEPGNDGLVVLVFPPMTDDAMFALAAALPIHLSAKVGYVVHYEAPFTPSSDD
ncbi:hypothetical protein [Sphingomonas sp. VNH70]|uniref:hypothetical protein n=1 Tax=Sphingomonas silueang TaxID=3156617 RepID=UPI0032B3F509